MNIQIFGKSKCFDTKKAQRYFKERRVKVQSIDVEKYGMSQGEFRSVKSGAGGLEALIDQNSKLYEQLHIAYLERKDRAAFAGKPGPFQNTYCAQRKAGHSGLSAGYLENMGMRRRGKTNGTEQD